ncbi:MAG TPA: MFS transporter [Trinickia sp.]|jgi:MFS family permease|nr:MFS transporter [Trinickia sp.]
MPAPTPSNSTHHALATADQGDQGADSTRADHARTLPFSQSLLAMLGIGMVNLLVALDQTTVSTALPAIVASLHGFAYYAWIASAYMLTSVIAVPIFGRIGDYYGRKPFVVAAITTFTIASVLCAIAPSMGALIGARALQGIGAGMMTGTAFASIPDLFPDPKARVRWQVVLATAYGIGTAAGPSLGGFLTDYYGWRSAFLINLPVGLAAAWCVVRYLPRFAPAARGPVQIDFQGAFLLSLLLFCLLVACGTIHVAEAMHGATIATVALPFLFGLFYVQEKRASSPIVPLGLFQNRHMVTLLCLSLLTGAVMFSLIFYVPLTLQAGLGLSATNAGKLATPFAAFIAVGSLMNTRIVTRMTRPATILSIGFALLMLACLGVSRMTAGGAYALLETSLLLGGIGLGLILNNLNIFAQETAGRAHVGIATSLMQSTRMIGGLLAVSTIGVWVLRRYTSRVGVVLDALPGAGGGQWVRLFDDPQVLVDREKEAAVLHLLAQAPFNGYQALDSLRQMFIVVLHLGFYLTAGLAALGVAVTLTIRKIQLHAKGARGTH